MTNKDIFMKAFNGQKNFMSPRIIGYYGKLNKIKSHKIICELSMGRKFLEETSWFYAVSIIIYNCLTKAVVKIFDDSRCFETIQDAKEYIRQVKDSFKIYRNDSICL